MRPEYPLVNNYRLQPMRWLSSATDELLEILPVVVKDERGRLVALFHSDFEIEYAKSRYKDLALSERPPTEEER